MIVTRKGTQIICGKPAWVEAGWDLHINCFRLDSMHKMMPPKVEKRNDTITVDCFNLKSNEFRIVPPEIEIQWLELDIQIKELRQRQRQLLTDSFLTFPFLTKSDCSRIIPAKYQTEASAKEALKRYLATHPNQQYDMRK